MSSRNVPAVNSALSPDAVPPNLGSIVSAELEAMRNDLEQAHALAEDYRWQLAGKSNECADLRHLLEKAKDDLGVLERDIIALRRDRHRLANEAMKAQAAEQYAAENASLREEVGRLRRALFVLTREGASKHSCDKDAHGKKGNIIELDFDT